MKKASAGQQVQGEKEGNGGGVSVYAHMKLSKNKRFLGLKNKILELSCLVDRFLSM